MHCLLCRSKNLEEQEKIDHRFLNELYRQFLKFDFSYLINQDLSYLKCCVCGLRFFSPMITGDEKFYNLLQKIGWYYLDNKSEYLEAKKYINPREKVLEVGCGKGAFAKLLPENEYVGLDFSLKAKEMASSNGIIIENKDIIDFAAENREQFDVCVSFQVLEHVSNPSDFLSAQFAAVRSGGRVIVAVPSDDSFLQHAPNSILNLPPHHVTRWNDFALKYIAEQNKAKIVTISHERVQNIHEKFFLTTLFQSIVLKPKLIDSSWKRRLLELLASGLASILNKRIQPEFLPNGHTVISVYEKI